jgi:type IV pilus assembly protein PilX
MRQHLANHHSQRGMTLIAAMLLLIVITILGVGMFHNFGIQERIAGNTREKTRALQAAESAEAYVEWWFTANKGANVTSGVTCAAGVTTAMQVCSNTLTSAASSSSNLPLNIGGAETATTYTPTWLTTGSDSANIYYAPPRVYISFITGLYDQKTGTTTNTYTINSLGYGGTASSMAEVESTYVVNVLYTTTNSKSKFINLGGP